MRTEAGRRIRTLLVDNYDSFTYNLFQLIGTVNGCAPTVVRNDEIDPAVLDLSGYDNVVISPGPGRPDVARDFGISRHLVESAELPLLGVCLGHQGIVLAAGGEVVTAPVPRHGFPDRIRHDGRDLFEGLPADFTAVRYHSLCAATPLPAALEVTATADDGVIMGVRHRTRPQWGVQFHPESVSSEHGAALLRNFARLTERYSAERTGRRAARSPGRTPAPTVPAPPAERPVRRFEVRHEVLGAAVDAEATFGRLYAAASTAFWLDSALAEPGAGRFSFLGDAAGPAAEVVRYRVGDGLVRVRTHDGERRVPGTVLDYLATELSHRQIEFPDVPFDFAGGYVGYLGYEVKADCGAAAAHRSPTPDAMWVFADRFVAIDHHAGRTHLIALCEPESDAAQQLWLTDTRAVLESALELSRAGHAADPGRPDPATADAAGGEPSAAGDRRGPTAPAGDGARDRSTGSPEPEAVAHPTTTVASEAGSDRTQTTVDLVTGFAPVDSEAVAASLTRGRARYLADIADIHAALRAGETYEVTLTDQLTVVDPGVACPAAPVATTPNPAATGERPGSCSSPAAAAHSPGDGEGMAEAAAVYRALRQANPAPYAALLRFEELDVACSSPERFLKVGRDREVESKPIKGTAPRGRDAEADETLRRALELDPKTRAENLMIVDLLRNDLGRVCELGSVYVPELMAVETYATLHQLVSTVRGRLRPGIGVIDCLRACFPGGSMTGAPRSRTMEIIDALETEARGVYSGTLGFLGLGGTADLNIVIRTAVRHDGRWRIGAGGAIVLDSEAEAEFHEMTLKAAAPLRAVRGQVSQAPTGGGIQPGSRPNQPASRS
ncbi:chorismate-binding protein [Nocardia sp. alder85J]|uniref:chorismate-binding protein n=1 Tax=Nocardia sp. alder85J TaxID=2862949 RepID=UPI001CD79503|nr:chorismate-binding protein [Nocardia sp. alder85J]MCX4099036.1 chorismate-binding protein [Nocardia sp. alder85J]